MSGLLVATPSATYRSFVSYARGEIELARGDTAEAVTQFEAAADEAWEVGATFIWGIASTVLATVLVDHGTPHEARQHLPRLVERWRRTATWPQLWTTLRLVAAHLAATGQPDVARLVVTAGDLDPAAPLLSGDDLARIDRLREQTRRELGDAAARAVDVAAAAVDRLTVLDRASEALTVPIAD